MIYLDYAADTPACEAALAAFLSSARDFRANPNSTHPLGLQARNRLNQATARIAALLDILPEELVITSGATEANNLAILGAARAYRSHGRHLITSMMEHSSVFGAMTALKEEGFELDFVRVQQNGQVDPAHLKSLLRPDTILVSLCAVDSEVGVIQPVDRVRELVSGFPSCRLHVDATQMAGKLPLHSIIKCADLFTLSPHKFYGLNGSGALIVRGGLRLNPLWYGGMGATPYRGGTPMLSMTVAMEAALQEALTHLDDRLTRVCRLNRLLRERLHRIPSVLVNSPSDASAFILNFSLPGTRARDIIALLAEDGFCVSSKSACCAPLSPSRPVMAMTGDRKRAMSTIRVSLSHLTTETEIESFSDALKRRVESGDKSNGKS